MDSTILTVADAKKYAPQIKAYYDSYKKEKQSNPNSSYSSASKKASQQAALNSATTELLTPENITNPQSYINYFNKLSQISSMASDEEEEKPKEQEYSGLNYLNNLYENTGGDKTEFVKQAKKNDDYLEYLKQKQVVDEDASLYPEADSFMNSLRTFGVIDSEKHNGWDYDPNTGTLVNYPERQTSEQAAKTESLDEASERRSQEGETIVPSLSGLEENPSDSTKVTYTWDNDNPAMNLFNAGLEAGPAIYSYISNLRRNLADNNASYTYKTDDGDIKLDDLVGYAFDDYINNNGNYVFTDNKDDIADKDNKVGYSKYIYYAPSDPDAYLKDPDNYDDWVEIGSGGAEDGLDTVAPGSYDEATKRYITNSGYSIPVDDEGNLAVVSKVDIDSTVDADDPSAIAWSGTDNFTTDSGQTVTFDQVNDMLTNGNFENENSGFWNIATTEPNLYTDDEGNFDIGKMISNLPAATIDLFLGTAPFMAGTPSSLLEGNMVANSALNGIDPFSYTIGEGFDNPNSQDAEQRALAIADAAANTFGEHLAGIASRGALKPLTKFLPSTDELVSNPFLADILKLQLSGGGEGFEEILQDIPALVESHWGANQATDEEGNNVYDSEGNPVYDDNTSTEDRLNNLENEALSNAIPAWWLTNVLGAPGIVKNKVTGNYETKEQEPTGSSLQIDDETMDELLKKYANDRGLRVNQ